jgi:DNA mismatch repair protein MutS2
MEVQAHTASALDWTVVLDHLAQQCRTIMGAEAARRGALAPTRQDALQRYAAVQELLSLEAAGDTPPIGEVTDLRGPLDRAGRGAVLELPELQAVGRGLRGLWRLRHWIEARAEAIPVLDGLAQPIEVDGELLYTLDSAFDDSGQLADAAWPELAELRAGIRATRRRVQSILEELLRGDEIADSLQDRYITEREGRLVVPVKAARRSRVGIVHDTSGSGETAYVEPSQVVEPQNRLASLQIQARREEHRILAQLSSAVALHSDALRRSFEAATELDLASARAALGQSLAGTIPRVGTDGVMDLRAARHPVLALRGVDVVPNDLRLDGARPGLVLTGPNAGGKTVALKTLGLAALFVHAGIPFPAAEGSRVDWFEEILADIGDLQTVEQDLSTFSGHLLLLGRMLEQASPGRLLLIDEMAVGTDPAQGAALARAALEAMVDAGARVVLTTHYLELKALAGQDPRFALMGAQYLGGNPTWRLLPDLVGQSHALSVARRLGVPGAVVARAEALLGTRATDLASLMEQVEQEQQQVRERAEALTVLEGEISATRMDLEARERKIEERRVTLERRVTEDFVARLREREEGIKRLIAGLQRNPRLEDAGRLLDKVRQIRHQVEAEVAEPEPEGAPPESLAPGDRVTVRSLRREATVVEVKDDGRVQVAVGTLRSWVKLDDLILVAPRPQQAQGGPRKRRGKKARPARQQPSAARRGDEERWGGVRRPGNSLDLRGKRLDEAIEDTETFLDALVLRGEPVAWVLTGHGTGALKEGLRRWVKTSHYVGRWRAAQEGEGGDAWTVIELA